MNEKYAKLTELIAEVQDLNHCGALIGWDQHVYMPAGAAEERGHMQATLAKVVHEKFVSDEIGSLLADLKKELPDLDQDSEEYRIIKSNHPGLRKGNSSTRRFCGGICPGDHSRQPGLDGSTRQI